MRLHVSHNLLASTQCIEGGISCLANEAQSFLRRLPPVVVVAVNCLQGLINLLVCKAKELLRLVLCGIIDWLEVLPCCALN